MEKGTGSMARTSLFVALSVLCMALLFAAHSKPASNITAQPERIDTHAHYVPAFYKALLDSRNVTAGGLPIPSWTASAHLALNAKFNIRTSILSVSTPGAKLSKDAPIDEGRTLARQLNDYGYNLTKEYPQDFLFFGTLTLPDLDGAVAEAIYVLDTLRAAGVTLQASNWGELLGTPRYAPLYKVLDDRKATVFVHPSQTPCAAGHVEPANSTGLPSFVIDFLLDTSRAAVNLAYRNVTRDYPNIKWILAHAGGFLPFAASRAAGGLAYIVTNKVSQALYYAELQNFLVDLAISTSPTSLPSTMAFFNTTHMTFGSDFPYAPPLAVAQATGGLQNYRLGNDVKRDINFRNAHRIFKKFLKY